MGGLSRVRTRAPELPETGWVDGGPLTLAGLRGRIVLLDFFTGGCVNCRHVMREIADLEARLGPALQVVGVHAPKFPHEAEPAAVRSAVARLGIAHPVVSDPDHRLLEQYAARAWPTLVLVGPTGRVEATAVGEGHGPALAEIAAGLLADVVLPPPAEVGVTAGAGAGSTRGPTGALLRHPQGLARLPGEDLLVADTGHGAVTRLDPDGTRLRSRVDGLAGPTGLAVLPGAVAAEVGYDVVVADPAAHALVGLRLTDGALRRLAGTGARRTPAVGPPVGPARDEALASPEDAVWWAAEGVVAVAMAGLHQVWAFDPRHGSLAVLAGTGAEQWRDGPADRALLAQPTALAVDGAGALWFVDAESSALRRLPGGRLAGGRVSTAVGAGLFASGHVDGPADRALLQHPQGLAVLPGGDLLVCDTYNGALRRWDAGTRTLATVATGLDEPVAAVPVAGEAAASTVLVAGATADRLVPVVLAAPGPPRG